MASPAPRTFLLTVHEPSSAVLEDLRTGQRVHVAELADLGPQIADWLAATKEHQSSPPIPHQEGPSHA